MSRTRTVLRATCAGMAMALLAGIAHAKPTVTDIEFASRPGSKFEIRLDFNEPPP